MQWDFDHATYISKQGFFETIFGRGKNSRYKKMLAKADISVSRELDLVKFIQRQRLTTFTSLVSLNARQKYVADKMATKIIRESSDLDDNESEDFELDQENVFDI